MDEAGSKVKVWMMDEARFGLHTELRRVWTRRGQRPVVARQIKYEWDYLYGALSVMGGEAHFAHVPGVSLDWDQGYLGDLAASDPGANQFLNKTLRFEPENDNGKQDLSRDDELRRYLNFAHGKRAKSDTDYPSRRSVETHLDEIAREILEQERKLEKRRGIPDGERTPLRSWQKLYLVREAKSGQAGYVAIYAIPACAVGWWVVVSCYLPTAAKQTDRQLWALAREVKRSGTGLADYCAIFDCWRRKSNPAYLDPAKDYLAEFLRKVGIVKHPKGR